MSEHRDLLGERFEALAERRDDSDWLDVRRRARRRSRRVRGALLVASATLLAILFAAPGIGLGGRIVGLFPEKMLRGETQRGAWYGFDVRHPGDWLRLPPLLYATIFLPAGYEHWSRTALREWPVVHLAAGLVVAPLVLWAARRFGPPESIRAAVLGLVWPLVVIGPILGARPDLYRLGLLPALAFALALGAVVMILERPHVVGRDPKPFPSGAVGLLPSVAAALLAVLLVPITIDTIRAWRPDGFFAARAIEWSRRHEDWQASLTPESRALFLAQVEHQEHAQRLLADGHSP